MRKLLGSLLLALQLTFVSGAQAQTTNCQWFGAVWSCSQSPPVTASPGIQWQLLQPDSVAQGVMDSFQRGVENGQRARQAQLERERLQAETELYRAQAQAVRDSAATYYAPTPQPQPIAPTQPDYLQKWRAAAQPRMALFPDFNEVVFAPDVTITADMVVLMTSSPFAADIAYYLATHKAESSVIAQLPLLDVARAIDRIERQIKEDEAQPTEAAETEPSP